MFKLTLVLLATPLGLALAPGAQADDPKFPFADDFGAGAAQRWRVMHGDWQFEGGKARQANPDFDCGAAIAIRPDGPFYLSVRFKPESGFNGGGLFFALPGVDRKHGGMLVRCDPGGRILWGWFDAGGTFNYYADAMYDEDNDQEQELALAVDPQKLAFNIYHHGERIATNVRTFHVAGYVGIQSSGGPHVFTHFEVRPATAAELTGLKAPGSYSRIIGVIGNDQGVLALRNDPNLLLAYNARGDQTETVNARDVIGPETTDARPRALSWAVSAKAPGGHGSLPAFLMLLRDGASVYRHKFGEDLQAASAPLAHVPDMRGTALAVDPAGRIFVADESVPGIRVLDGAGKELAKFGEKGPIAAYDRSDPQSAGKFKSPRGIAIAPDGKIVVTDRENFTYVVYNFDPKTNQFEFVRNGTWLPNPAQVFFDSRGKMLLAGPFEYYHGYGALRVMSSDGLGEKTFLAHSMKNMSDKVRACEGPGGKYYVADPDQDRFFVLPPDFVEKLPDFAWTADGGVQLIMTKVDGTQVVTTTNERGKDGRVVVRQKEPICETWPPLEPEELTAYSLPPAPPKGKTYVIDMPVLVAVFTRATDENGKEVTIDPAGIIDRLKRELARARDFYWHCSHATLNIQFDYMTVDDAAAKVEGGWIQPTTARTMVNQARAKQSLPPIDNDHSLIGIHPMPGFDPKDTDDPGFVGGGGLTPYAYSGYALWNHGQAWLMAHEWGHQLDGYFDKSGFPDWWLNHPDGTVHIGRYGEHWDCNAFLCRRADKLNWLRFKFGTLRAVADADGDGLADDDASLPMDEKRFGSDPTKRDTDGDGLDDLAELCAGSFSSSDPRNPDTNNNGVRDGQDPLPQFAVRTTVAAGRDKCAPLGHIRSVWADADISAWYEPDVVHFEVRLDKPARSIFIPLDWNNDGWFVGQDNFYYSVDLDWPKEGAAKIRGAHDCDARLRTADGQVTVEIDIRRPPSRSPLTPGTSLAACPRLQNGGGTIAFLLDPWQLLGLELR